MPNVPRRQRPVLLAAFCTGILSCQNAPSAGTVEILLSPADGRLDEGLTYVSSVRELSDGQVLVTDPREGRILLASMETGSFREVAREGAGPGEWSHAVALHALRGDSSLQMDFVARRWLTFYRDKVVGSLPPDEPIVLATLGRARGTDSLGRVLALVASSTAHPGVTTRGDRDSIAAVLYRRDSDRADTVAWLRDAPATIHSVRGSDGSLRDVFVSRPALAVGEEAALFRDGWLAIARLNPYRIDWIDPGGSVTLGSALPVPIVPMDASEREFYLARAKQQFADPEGHMPSAMREAVERRFRDLPNEVPPFAPNSLVAGGDGLLYVKRTPTVLYPEPRYDVIDRSGQLLGHLALSPKEHIAAVGLRHIYVVFSDSSDVQKLRRHPAPSF